MAEADSKCFPLGTTPNGAVAITVVVLLGISFYNGLELFVTVFLTFKRRQGLYFWSLLVTCVGVVGYAVTNFLLIFTTILPLAAIITVLVFWTLMVTGMSMVMYSRLHLMVTSKNILRWVLGMILVNAVVLHITHYGISINAIKYTFQDTPWQPWVYAEKTVATIFTVQEVIISGVYLWQAVRILRPESQYRNNVSRSVLLQLIAANVFIILLDIVFLFFEWAQLWGIWCAFKGFCYSIKLRIEFAILNQLRRAVTGVDFRSINTRTNYNTGKPRRPSDQDPSVLGVSSQNPAYDSDDKRSTEKGASRYRHQAQEASENDSISNDRPAELSSVDDCSTLRMQYSKE